MDLYFECYNGISGDMSVGALLNLGASEDKLKIALDSMNLDDEFSYEIKKQMVNQVATTDFNVILKNHKHIERNLDDINKIIDKVKMDKRAAKLAKQIFKIIAEAEAKVHNKDIKDIHFHEVGAIDSIVDIVGFSVLFYDLCPDNVYFSTLHEGMGFVECQHGTLPVPVPAVAEIARKYSIPIKITENEGEMITPTGMGIVAALYLSCYMPDRIIIERIGYGKGKRPYKNPTLRIMKIKEI